MRAFEPILLILTLILPLNAAHQVWFGKHRATTSRDMPHPHGVRGWLAFLVFNCLSVGPLLQVGYSLSIAQSLARQGFGDGTFLMLVACLLACWQLWVGWQLLTVHSPQSVKHAITFYWGSWVCSIIASPFFLPGWVSTDIKIDTAFRAVFAGWPVLLWIWYLKKSVRVANTYALHQAPVPQGEPTPPPAQFGPAGANSPVMKTDTSSDPRPVAERLEILKRLLDQQLISPQDYELKKQQLLDEL